MTKKRHEKLLRCFLTRLQAQSKKNGRPVSGVDIRNCIDNHNSLTNLSGKTKGEWWQDAKGAMAAFDMDTIKEYQ